MIFGKKVQLKPLKKGVAKVPVVMQLEAVECGAASLAMIMRYYRKWISLEQIRLDSGVSRDGSNAKNILRAARSYGMIAKAWRMEPEALLAGGPFPCIVHWGFNHFVVLCGFKGKKAVLNDPARGSVTVEWDEFDREFTGVCLTFEPGEEFVPSGKKRPVLAYAKESLSGNGSAVAFVMITAVIASLISAMQPVYSRVFMDRLLTGSNPGWFKPFMLAYFGLALLTVAVAWVSTLYSYRIEGKMASVGSTAYLWKVLRLPVQFFDQRRPADIAECRRNCARVSDTMVNIFGPLTVNTVMMLVYLVIIIRYDAVLTLIGVGSIILNLLLNNIIANRRSNIARVHQRDSAKLAAITMSGISMIETIKASGDERGFFDHWSGCQAKVNKQDVRYQQAGQVLSALPLLITALANTAVLGIGIYYIIIGKFTIGMLAAFQEFLTLFFAPASSLLTAGRSMQKMITQMERVDDVMHCPEDPCFEMKEKTGEYEKFSGFLEMKEVAFGYSPLSEPLIHDFSMTVKPGMKIALVGRSGCGKSTLAKLISGLYQPWSGEILFDGKSLKDIDRNVFTGSVAVINQDITLFEDTISANIKMWDDSIEDFEVIMAARDAGIHNDILMRAGGYRHKLAENGRDLSGGQRQRIEIARALAQDPTICIMDEATSALDAKTEHEIMKSITDRGITCIVIAHRLSAIRDCDEIIVLDHGCIAERGTHEELFAKNGIYTELVSNE